MSDDRIEVGQYVEVIYRGHLATSGEWDDMILIRPEGGFLRMPTAIAPEVRVIDPPEPTRVGTVVCGWPTEGDDRPEAMYVYVLTGTDADGDGRGCWQRPGETHEFDWSRVLDDTRYGRKVYET